MVIKISESDFPLLKKYIEEQCSITLRDSQKYLLESRLTKLVIEQQCSSFYDFYQLAKQGKVPGLKEKIINAMTTNETLWFRDSHPWQTFRDVILPKWDNIDSGSEPFRIWSAASSTGQEAYSIAMIINEYNKNHPRSTLRNRIKIIGTDISTSALYVAISGNYDDISMNRGFIEPWTHYKTSYFTKRERVWEISSEIKRMVEFKQFNLKDKLDSLGTFDLICLRNVIIYFSDTFKRNLFSRLEQRVRPEGYLLLGASETPIRYTDQLRSVKINSSTYYQLK